MKLGENIHLVSALSFSNISLIGSKLWIFYGVDFFRGRLFLGVELFPEPRLGESSQEMGGC